MSTLNFFVSLFLLHGNPGNISYPALRTESFVTLNKVAACSDFWVKVHAIEYLADLGYREEARKFIEKELDVFETVPEKRIGVWRAKYKTAATQGRRAILLGKIRDAYLDVKGPDRVHAAETLAKLGFPFKKLDQEIVSGDLSGTGMLFSFVLWGYALPASPKNTPGYALLLKQLKNKAVAARRLAAYALGFFRHLPQQEWDTLARAALEEPEGSEAHAFLLGAAYALYDFEQDQNQPAFREIRKRLLMLEKSASKADRVELCRALAAHPQEKDTRLLARLLQLKDPLTLLPGGIAGKELEHPWNLDVQAAAAYALLLFFNHK